MGIRSFRDSETQEVAEGADNKRTRRKLPKELHRAAVKKHQILRAANDLEDLAAFPGLRFERLKGKRKDEFSIRINEQYRICFRFSDGDSFDVVIEDYH